MKNVVKLALNEDLYPVGDITSDLINSKKNISLKLNFQKELMTLKTNSSKILTKSHILT